ncbi:unnamed protein product [Thelazia callipaeda]|uniref:Secreted protein n=1 Tax=Thelazia callipaeda TaxID=103827 RepID=A0A0N5CN02_THECL|nr:unnamed protein product [Thelazia callipaeda]
MINMIFFLALLALSCWLVALKMKAYFELRQADMPCLYQFKPWSECSATCWAENESMPLMKREIDETKLVLARGKSFAKCPPNIKKGLVQRAPCNLQK